MRKKGYKYETYSETNFRVDELCGDEYRFEIDISHGVCSVEKVPILYSVSVLLRDY